jgi:Fe-S-cluster containining protein
MKSAVDAGDVALIQIVDAALAEAARKSGPWLVCRLGCTQCCMGPFAITQLDAYRLRRGLAELEFRDPARAIRVRQRAREAVARISNDFPGDAATGLLADNEFPDSMDQDPCPALDPETGGCDLYAARPITCRTFGPPVRCGEEAVGVCELCFQGASDAEIAACEVESDPDGLELRLLKELEQVTGARGETIVAFALAS